MEKSKFEREMAKARTMRAAEPERDSYWLGFMRGLRRRYHGTEFGTDDEHQRWLTLGGDPGREQRSEGYQDGYFGPVDWSEIPTAIKSLRHWRGWTTDELGAMCGRTGRTVEGWEQSRPVPKAALALLKKIWRDG